MGGKSLAPRNSSVTTGARAFSQGPHRVKLHSRLEATFNKGSEGNTIETRNRRKAHSNTVSNQENIYQRNLREQRSGSERHPSSIKKPRKASRSVDPTSQSVG